MTRNLAVLEFFPIVLAVEIWGSQFCNKKIHFNCDNMGVVMAINSVSASLPMVVRLLRHLLLTCLHCNSFVYAVHVPDCTNSLDDALSQFQWEKFHSLAP